MGRSLLFALTAILVGGSASAKSLLDFSLSAFGPSAPVCEPPKDESFRDQNSAKTAYAKALAKKRPCDAAEAAIWLARVSDDPTPENAIWGGKAVQAYAQKGDFHQATVEGLRLLNGLAGETQEADPEAEFLDEDNADLGASDSEETATVVNGLTPAELEPIRFAVVEAVFGACQKLGIDRDVTWRNWALGLHAPSSDNERSLSLLAYLEDFPETSNAHMVREQTQQLMALTIDSEIAIAHSLARTGKTYSALARLEYLYRYPQLSDSNRFQSIVELIVILQDRLIGEIPKMRDQSLRDMLRLPTPSKVNHKKVQEEIRTRLCKIYPTWNKLGKNWAPSTEAREILKRRCR